MNKPSISICIPAYNRSESLKRLLSSIIRQTTSPLEVIISDDSSDDSNKNIVEEYKELNIKYFKNIPAAGTPKNWNVAIDKAKGDWIKLMHDDDWFETDDALQMFSEAASFSNADFIFSACNYVSSKNKKSEVLNRKDYENLQSDKFCLLAKNIIGHPSVVMHRNISNIRYNEAYKWVVDIDFYVRFFEENMKFHFIDQPLINIGVGESQISSDCYKNPAVEIPEYLSVINSLGEKAQGNKFIFFSLWNLIKKFKIKNSDQIHNYYKGILPTMCNYIIDVQNKIPGIILKQTPASKYFMNKAFQKYIRST